MKKRYVWFACCLTALALGLAACGSSGESGSGEGSGTAEETAEETTDDTSDGESGASVNYEPVLYEDLTSTLVSLGEYRGLEARRQDTTVTDEEVQDEVDAIKKSYSELVSADREAQEGDVVVIDFTGYIDGETSDSMQGTEYSLELGSGEMIPGFEDQLIGAVADETRELNLTFPEDYYEEVAGKDVVFEIYVHEVQEYVLEDWGDEFVRENLEYDSIADMESQIRAELEQYAQEEADDNLQYDLVETFLAGCEFRIQEADVEAYIDQMMSEYETYALMYGMELDEFLEQALGATQEQMREAFRETADFRVQMTLAFHAVAEQEGIAVSEEAYQEQLQSLAGQYGYEDASEIEEVYSRAMIEEQMVQEQVISLIVENAVIS